MTWEELKEKAKEMGWECIKERGVEQLYKDYVYDIELGERIR